MCTDGACPSVKKYKVVATKVSPEAADLLADLAHRRGTTTYTLLQEACKVFLALMSSPVAMSDSLATMLRLFEDLSSGCNSFNPCDPTTRQSIDSAVYFVAGQGRSGTSPVLVSRTPDGLKTQNGNVQEILEAFLCKAIPGFYRRLRAVGVALGCNSVYETVDRVLTMYEEDPNARDLRELFGDNSRSEFGLVPVSSPYIRHPHRDLSSFENNEQKRNI